VKACSDRMAVSGGIPVFVELLGAGLCYVGSRRFFATRLDRVFIQHRRMRDDAHARELASRIAELSVTGRLMRRMRLIPKGIADAEADMRMAGNLAPLLVEDPLWCSSPE